MGVYPSGIYPSLGNPLSDDAARDARRQDARKPDDLRTNPSPHERDRSYTQHPMPIKKRPHG